MVKSCWVHCPRGTKILAQALIAILHDFCMNFCILRLPWLLRTTWQPLWPSSEVRATSKRKNLFKIEQKCGRFSIEVSRDFCTNFCFTEAAIMFSRSRHSLKIKIHTKIAWNSDWKWVAYLLVLHGHPAIVFRVYSKALRCTFFGERKNSCSSKFVQLLLLNRVKARWSENRAAQGFHFINLFISSFFGPNSKTCTCEVRAARGRVSQGLTVFLFWLLAQCRQSRPKAEWWMPFGSPNG